MKTNRDRLGRRAWLGGAASIGAAVAGSMALNRRDPVAEVVGHAAKIAPTSEPETGYQLTEHVKRYYATARI